MNKIIESLNNYRSAVVPGITSLMCVVWLVLEPGPEPVVVMFGALLATYISYAQLRDTWKNEIQGNLYTIHYRGNPEFIHDLSNQLLVVKWTEEIHNAEGHTTLNMDAIGPVLPEKIHEIARESYRSLYWINKNGKQIWENEEI